MFRVCKHAHKCKNTIVASSPRSKSEKEGREANTFKDTERNKNGSFADPTIEKMEILSLKL